MPWRLAIREEGSTFGKLEVFSLQVMDGAGCRPPGWLRIESLPAGPECPCVPAGAFGFHAPHCDRAARPYVDDESLALIEDAVQSLVCFRGSGAGDAGAALSCLTSLVIEALSRLPNAVADARDHDYTWEEIAGRLATTASNARRRYGPYSRRRVVAPVETE